MVNVKSVKDLDDLVQQAASAFVDVVAQIQATNGGVHGDGVARVVLTGGTAGIRVLEKLAEFDRAASAQQDTFPAQSIDWQRVHVFFGDERNVPVSHEDSNEGQAREALLDHVNIPAEHIHSYGLDGKRSQDEAATAYEEILRTVAPNGFDIHLLGMGHEGHINTLFPHTDAVREKDHLVVAEYDSPKPPSERVTLTLPAVATADRVWLLVSGAEKAEAANHVINGANPEEWPAAGAQGRQETVLWLADDARP